MSPIGVFGRRAGWRQPRRRRGKAPRDEGL